MWIIEKGNGPAWLFPFLHQLFETPLFVCVHGLRGVGGQLENTFLDYEELERICDKYAINPRDSEFEVVYINGDHNIPTIFTGTEEEGGITRTLKLRQIEPEFLSRMFSGGS